jgi:hypothetical protein
MQVVTSFSFIAIKKEKKKAMGKWFSNGVVSWNIKVYINQESVRNELLEVHLAK